MRTILALYVVLTCVAWGQDNETAAGRLRIPNRPTKSLFEGEQGRQKADIYFDQSSGTVTLKFLVQDAHGYFIPGLRLENSVVYENGVRQTNATVEIEHAPVSSARLIEYGGRHAAMNRCLLNEGSSDGHELVEILAKDDKLALWPYRDKVTELSEFSSAKDNLDRTMLRLQPPDISETNLYDEETFGFTAERLNVYGLAYLHLVNPAANAVEKGYDPGPVPMRMLKLTREAYNGTLILAGGFDHDTAEAWLRNKMADLIAFGRKFLANPDLPERFRERASLNADDPSTYYTGGEKGYIDYLTLAQERGEAPKRAVDESWR